MEQNQSEVESLYYSTLQSISASLTSVQSNIDNLQSQMDALNTGANDYYIAVTDAPYTIQSGVQAALTEPGYMLVIDCYLDSGEKWKTFPTGVFNESPGLEDHTYSFDNSFVLYFDGTNYNQMHLSGPITISRDAQNIAKISTTFLDEDGIVGEAGTEYPISFEGDLRVGNGTTLPTMPHLMHDIEFKGVYAPVSYTHLRAHET